MNSRRFLIALFVLLGLTFFAQSCTPLNFLPARWTDEELGTLRGLWIGSLPPLPADPSNRYADNLAAAKLGEKLFF